nr:hypothetical protein [Tanacetum cinerariifolium]
MLKIFDRDDLVRLWDLVKERFSITITEPTDDKEKALWVKLKRLFEPDNDDILWKLQRYTHDPLVWRLYDTCGVHHVSTERGHDIFMLVEKEYPLTQGLMIVMIDSIERFLNDFANQPNETNTNDLEFNDESVDTPLVSPFPHSGNDSDDGEVLNEIIEYENVGMLRREKAINSFDRDDLAF